MTVGDDTRPDLENIQAERGVAGSPLLLVADPAAGWHRADPVPADGLPSGRVGRPGAAGRPGSSRTMPRRCWPRPGPAPCCPQHGEGWFGRPGLSGHRLDTGAGYPAAGRDWSPLFRAGAVRARRPPGPGRGRGHDRRPGAGDRDRGGAGRRDPRPAHADQPRPPALPGRQPGGGLPVAGPGRRGPGLHRAADRRAHPAAAPDRRRAVAARRPPRSHRPRLGHRPGGRRPRLRLRPRRGLRPARRLERQHRAPRRASAVRPGHGRSEAAAPGERDAAGSDHHRRRRAAAARRDHPGRGRVLRHARGSTSRPPGPAWTTCPPSSTATCARCPRTRARRARSTSTSGKRSTSATTSAS